MKLFYYLYGLIFSENETICYVSFTGKPCLFSTIFCMQNVSGSSRQKTPYIICSNGSTCIWNTKRNTSNRNSWLIKGKYNITSHANPAKAVRYPTSFCKRCQLIRTRNLSVRLQCGSKINEYYQNQFDHYRSTIFFASFD